MRITVVEDSATYPGEYPALTLVADRWDDYGYKTTFRVSLWTSNTERIDLGATKIMQLGMTSGAPALPLSSFEGLPEDFGSIGADFSYYQKLLATGLETSEAVLSSMNDLSIDSKRRERFMEEDAFHTSLARLAPAKDGLERVQSLLDTALRSDEASGASQELSPVALLQLAATFGASEENKSDGTSQESRSLRIRFEPSLPAGQQFEPRALVVDFAGPPNLPGSLVALVGPNGTGKTTLLSGLALALFFGSDATAGGGTVEIETGSVRDVIFVSFSAYDNFEMPKTQSLSDDARGELAAQGYIYVGLRQLTQEALRAEQRDRIHTLKSPREIDDEFVELLAQIRQAPSSASNSLPDRQALFIEAISALFDDPSVKAIAELPALSKSETIIEMIAGLFSTLSTGHKAIMNIIASLCVYLNKNSLVLMDEPEAHLHPPLVATLLRIVRTLLKSFDANAIVATHSPIVIQETLAEHVIRFSRISNRTNWEVHGSQTFGENIAALTRSTFGLPAASADFIGVLRALTTRKSASLDGIEAIFGERGLSSPARAQVLRLLAARRLGQVE